MQYPSLTLAVVVVSPPALGLTLPPPLTCSRVWIPQETISSPTPPNLNISNNSLAVTPTLPPIAIPRLQEGLAVYIQIPLLPVPPKLLSLPTNRNHHQHNHINRMLHISMANNNSIGPVTPSPALNRSRLSLNRSRLSPIPIACQTAMVSSSPLHLAQDSHKQYHSLPVVLGVMHIRLCLLILPIQSRTLPICMPIINESNLYHEMYLAWNTIYFYSSLFCHIIP